MGKNNLTWLGALNYFLLQWFFIRLAKVVDVDTDKFIKWKIIFKKPLTGWKK